MLEAVTRLALVILITVITEQLAAGAAHELIASAVSSRATATLFVIKLLAVAVGFALDCTLGRVGAHLLPAASRCALIHHVACAAESFDAGHAYGAGLALSKVAAERVIAVCVTLAFGCFL